ncbi:MAG TPA: hypothetical protein VFM06_07140 [Candidatus Limnocylindria bacterium]|nr:hypothetical protein [Candidatus Limnocylindria bacterium]
MSAPRRLAGVAFAAAAAAAAAGLAASAPAEASCAPPEPLPQRIARADAVVFGHVVSFEGGAVRNPRALIVRVERVYKGDVVERIFVSAGPGGEGGGAPGQVVATSVDYLAEQGSEHTFYLKQHAPAGFSTDACSGSHPGDLDAEERAALGAGSPPGRVPGGVGSATDADRAIGVALLLASLGATYVAARAVLARPAG